MRRVDIRAQFSFASDTEEQLCITMLVFEASNAYRTVIGAEPPNVVSVTDPAPELAAAVATATIAGRERRPGRAHVVTATAGRGILALGTVSCATSYQENLRR